MMQVSIEKGAWSQKISQNWVLFPSTPDCSFRYITSPYHQVSIENAECKNDLSLLGLFQRTKVDNKKDFWN